MARSIWPMRSVSVSRSKIPPEFVPPLLDGVHAIPELYQVVG